MNRIAFTFLNSIERIGNRLPHPTTLFVIFIAIVLLASWLCSLLEVSATHPITQKTIFSVNLLSQEGLHRILSEMVTNFTHFAPLGSVLVAMLGLGIAEHSGLISSALRSLMLATPQRLLTFVVVFAGALSSIAVDAGYVVLIPLSGILFQLAGRHPIAGIAATFAGVSGGFSANLLIGPVDAMLAGISTEAAQLLDSNAEVNATANFYFIFVSTFLIALIGGWVTERYVEPRLAPLPDSKIQNTHTELRTAERNGLVAAGVIVLLVVMALLFATVPENGILRHPETGSIIRSPFMQGLIPIIFITTGLAGIVYGIVCGRFNNDKDVIGAMEKTMAMMASYLVLMFFAAQFVSYFAWTNLGLISAIKGASWLQTLELSAVTLLITFVLMAAVINLLIGSASAKWSILAPVFVPMMMLLHISPEATQAAYRVGDSVTNIITPLMPYFGVVVAFTQNYDKKAGIGTIAAMMLPYSLFFLIGWSLLLSIWFALGLPLGPDTSLAYPHQ